jgi:hypothetical protein
MHVTTRVTALLWQLDPEDGGIKSLRNVGDYMPTYTAQYSWGFSKSTVRSPNLTFHTLPWIIYFFEKPKFEEKVMLRKATSHLAQLHARNFECYSVSVRPFCIIFRRPQWPCGFRPLHCCNCGFEPRWRYEGSSLVFVVCRVSSGLCDGLFTRSEESYRVCVRVSVCDVETSTIRRPSPELGCCTTGKKSVYKTPRYKWVSQPDGNIAVDKINSLFV